MENLEKNLKKRVATLSIVKKHKIRLKVFLIIYHKEVNKEMKIKYISLIDLVTLSALTLNYYSLLKVLLKWLEILRFS